MASYLCFATAGSSHPAAVYASHVPSVTDIDYNNRDNPLTCSEYAVAIFNHLHEVEVSGIANSCAPMQAKHRMIYT